MLVNFGRTIFLYILILITMRVLGKKQVGQLETSEFVIVLLLSELAAVPMQDVDIPLMNCIIPIITLLCLEISVSLLSLKSKTLRDILQGKPTVIVRHGEMDIDALESTRYNIDEVMEEIRQAGYSDIRDVEFAVLENSGNVSVIPSARGRGVTPSDLGIKSSPGAMPYIVISDGKPDRTAMKRCGLSDSGLLKLLKKNGIKSPHDVFFAVYDSRGEFYFQLRQVKK